MKYLIKIKKKFIQLDNGLKKLFTKKKDLKNLDKVMFISIIISVIIR